MSILLKVKVEVRPRTQFEDGAEAVVVDLDCVVLLDDAPVIEVLVDFVLSNSVLDIVFFDLLAPVVVKVVNLTCNFSAIVEVKCLVHF